MTGLQNINISLKSRAYIDFIQYLCAMKYEKLKGKFSLKWLEDCWEYYSPIITNLYWSQYEYLLKKGYVQKIIDKYFSEVVKTDGKEMWWYREPDYMLNVWDLGVDDSIIATLKEQLEIKGGFREEELRVMFNITAGWNDYTSIHQSIQALNYGFFNLLKNNLPQSAMPLVRLQIENLTYLAAEAKYPFKILRKVYIEGKQLNEIKVKGKNLMPSTIRKELDEKLGTNIDELYRKYSHYIHPSPKGTNVRDVKTYYSYKEGREKISQKEIRRLSKDMILVNQVIADLLKEQIKFYRTAIKEQESKTIKASLN